MKLTVALTIVHRDDYQLPIKGELIGVLPETAGGAVRWHHGCCACSRDARLADHAVTIHEDRTVSVDPAVACPYEGCGAHYTIAHSRVRPAA